MTAQTAETIPGSIEYWAVHTPDQIALRDDSRELSYAELREVMNDSAHRLNSLGVHAGDRVVVVGHNSWQWVVAFLGALRLGAIAAPANTRLSPAQFAEQCAAIDATLVLTDRSLHPITAETTRPVRLLDGADGLFDNPVETTTELVDLPAATAPAVLSFTSGTTGIPKGAVLTHRAYHRGSAVFAEVMGTTAQDSTLVLVPLFHNTGFVDQLGQMLVVGGRTELLRKFSTTAAAQALADRPVSYITAVPSILRLLMVHEQSDQVYSRARVILYGGSPMPAAWTQELAQRFPAIKLYHGYGLTEFTSACTLLAPEHAEKYPESVGTPVPDVELRIVAEDGTDVRDGDTGEIWVAGPTRMREYWGRPEATAEKFSGPWLRTGDLGRSEDGLLYLSGRIDDVINRGGEKVLPSFVESVLCHRPDIAEACVFGVPDPVLQRRVHAAIKPRSAADFDEHQARALLTERLPDYAIPEVIHVVGEFPRGASGKVDRKAVAAQFIQALHTTEEKL
ncbi:class I adenylate-forming enzyme family protein [Rhodococcus koreensis]